MRRYDYYTDAGHVVSLFKRKGLKKLFIYMCPECSKFHLSSSKSKKNKMSKAEMKSLGIFTRE